MEQTSPHISIIVPVYKVEKYLPACIDSILAQTYENFELILVDDGSPDNCGKICDEYAQNDNRIKVIHQKNSGVIEARKNGIKSASGEYITFVDSDDTIPNDAIELLCKNISPNIDIVIGEIGVYSNNSTLLTQTRIIQSEIVDTQFYREFISKRSAPLQVGPYAKLFNRTLFDTHTFNIPREITVSEDWLMNIRIAFNLKKNVYFLNKIVYNYRQNELSATSRFQPTLQYYITFFKYFKASFPTKEREFYIDIAITHRLNVYLRYIGYSLELPFQSDFYKDLIHDIHKSNYKLPLIVKCFLYIKNPLIRFFLISLRKILNYCHINILSIDRVPYLNSNF